MLLLRQHLLLCLLVIGQFERLAEINFKISNIRDFTHPCLEKVPTGFDSIKVIIKHFLFPFLLDEVKEIDLKDELSS